MWKIFKVLLSICIFFTFTSVCFAECEDKNTDPEKDAYCELLKYYCHEKDATITGCFYNESTKDIYVKHPSTLYLSGQIEPTAFRFDSINLVRSYTGINENKEAVVATCSKGYVYNRGTYDVVIVSEPPKDVNEDKYVGIIYLRVYKTKKNRKGVYSCDDVYKDEIVYQDKEKAIKITHTATISPSIDVEGYTGYKDLKCPTYFFYTKMGGLTKYFNGEYEYVFSDDPKLKHTNSWFENLTNFDSNGKISGCLEHAEDAEEFSTQCYDEIIEKKIKTYTCPDKLSNFDLNVQSYIDECTARYNIDSIKKESIRLIEEQVAKATKTVKDAATNKINECYNNALVSKCELSTTEANNVISKLKSGGCYNSCPVGVKPENMDPSGKCYICNANSQGGNLKWSTTPITGCDEYPSAGIDDCYGNTKNQSCKNCYNNAVSGLTDTQKSCVLDLTSEAQQTITKTEEKIDETYQEDADKTNEANVELHENMYKSSYSAFTIPGFGDNDFGPINQSCAEILQNNLISIIKTLINAVRIAGVIIAIGNSMITLIPAVVSKDAEGLKKAEKKLVTMAIVLAAIGIFPVFVSLIGGIFEYDLTCIFNI